MKKITLIAAVFFSSLMILNAGDHKYSIGEKMSLKSEVLNEERSIIVYTPQTYYLGKHDYPVMYLLDGGAHFHHVSGIVQFLSGHGSMPEMIVVAVQNVDRTRDFSPTHNPKWPTTGGAEKFMGFLEDELMLYVSSNFRTQPYEILVGHSFGGTFAAYALLKSPDLFNAYIAISPYLMYDDDYMVKQSEKKLLKNYNEPVQFYMTVGDEPDYFETLATFQGIIEEKSPKGFEFTYVKMENENHGTIPHLSVYNGLESIYSGWRLPKDAFSEGGLAAVDDHYKMLSKKYGYDIETPEYTINALGYYLLNNDTMEKAIAVFKENVKRFPKSANVYDSLGEAYEGINEFEKAEKNYKIAVEYARKIHHPNLAIYEKNLKRMQDKLAVN